MKVPKVSTPSWKYKINTILDPISYLEKTAKSFPDMFQYKSLVYAYHPEAIQQIFTLDGKKLISPAGSDFIKLILGDSSLAYTKEEEHKNRKKLLMPPFHGNKISNYGDFIVKICHEILSKAPINKPFKAINITHDISIEIILRVVYGIEEEEMNRDLKYLINSVASFLQSPLQASFLFYKFLQKDLGNFTPWGGLLSTIKKIDNIIYTKISQTRQEIHQGKKDILSLLISAQDEKGHSLTDKQLRDELMLLMFGGYETTGASICWALYWIHKLPEVKEKLLQELDSLGENSDPITISRLPYLTAICKETLRIYPVLILSFNRVVKEPIELLGYQLEPNEIITACIYLLHHREDLYPQPKQFKPDRFLERKYSAYEFIPFGGSSRRCLGEALALFEMKLAIATILSNYDLALVDSRPEKPIRQGVVVAPQNGVKMILKGQRQSSKS